MHYDNNYKCWFYYISHSLLCSLTGQYEFCSITQRICWTMLLLSCDQVVVGDIRILLKIIYINITPIKKFFGALLGTLLLLEIYVILYNLTERECIGIRLSSKITRLRNVQENQNA